MVGLIVWIIFGGIAGWIASLILKTDAQQEIILNIILGIVGAVIGGVLMNMLGGTGITGFNLYSLLVAVLGAVIIIYLGKMIGFSR